jgi:hypothetical protein
MFLAEVIADPRLRCLEVAVAFGAACAALVAHDFATRVGASLSRHRTTFAQGATERSISRASALSTDGFGGL